MEAKQETTAEVKYDKQWNMEHYGSRIKQFRLKAGISVDKLAGELGVSKSSVRNWECGLTRPDPVNIYEMFDILGVSPSDFFGKHELTETEQGLVASYRSLDERGKDDVRGFVDAMQKRAWRYKVVQIYSKLISVPDYGRLAAAGDGAEWPEFPENDGVILYYDPLVAKADEIITVTGKSMEPKYLDQDRVLVEYCTELKVGDIGIFYVPGHGGVIKQKGHDRLHSLNPQFEDILPYEDGAQLIGYILGKVETEMIPDVEEANLYMEALAEKEQHPDWFQNVSRRPRNSERLSA